MLTTSSAPASRCTVVGPTSYQMSSQMFTPTRTPPMVKTGHSALAPEVALLVEDAVVGQQHLPVDRREPPAGGHRRAVVDAPAHLVRIGGRARVERLAVHQLGRAQDHGDRPAGGDQPLELPRGIGEELPLEQQVLGRIARDGQFRKRDHVGPPLLGLSHGASSIRSVLARRSPTVGLNCPRARRRDLITARWSACTA